MAFEMQDELHELFEICQTSRLSRALTQENFL